jgi:hypothetical protein
MKKTVALGFLSMMMSTTSLAQAGGQNIVDDAWATSEGYQFSGRVTEDGHRPAYVFTGG